MNLQAIEFQASIRDGNIQIPETYRTNLEGETVKVVLLKTERKTAAVGIIAQLIANPIPFNGQPLSRDELHDRTL